MQSENIYLFKFFQKNTDSRPQDAIFNNIQIREVNKFKIFNKFCVTSF